MNHTTREVLEGALKRAEQSVTWSREQVEGTQRQLATYMRAQLEDENCVAELKAALEEDA